MQSIFIFAAVIFRPNFVVWDFSIVQTFLSSRLVQRSREVKGHKRSKVSGDDTLRCLHLKKVWRRVNVKRHRWVELRSRASNHDNNVYNYWSFLHLTRVSVVSVAAEALFRTNFSILSDIKKVFFCNCNINVVGAVRPNGHKGEPVQRKHTIVNTYNDQLSGRRKTFWLVLVPKMILETFYQVFWFKLFKVWRNNFGDTLAHE